LEPHPAWCCSTFEDLADAPGRSGLSVFVATIGSHDDAFVLQARAVDVGDPQPQGASVPLTLVEDRCISHCPGCGVRLAKYYRSHLDVLRRDDLKIR